MCRLYGFRANESTKVECTLVHAQNALLLQSRGDLGGKQHPDGWGVAYYDEGRPHRRRRIESAYEDLHFNSVVERVYAHTVLAHVRLATVGLLSRVNTHPFALGNWVFAHNGTLPEFAAVKQKLEEETLPRFQEQRHGQTDSEQIFLWLMSRMVRGGINLDSACSPQDLREVLSEAVPELVRLAGRESKRVARLNFVLTDGRIMAATRWRHSLHWVFREGIRDCEICGVPHVHHNPRRDYRAVVIASEPITSESWRAVPEGHVLIVDQDVHVQLFPLQTSSRGFAERFHASSSNLGPCRSTSESPPRIAPPSDEAHAYALSRQLMRERPQLVAPPQYEDLRVQDSSALRGALHLDDVSGITQLDPESPLTDLQQRARLRAVTGDLVATSLPLDEAYEDYCREQLQLGRVQWLQTRRETETRSLAIACCRDRKIRRRLVREIRQGTLNYVHPHLGNQAVWELARLLSQTSHRAVQVLAPPPAVAAWANDKIAFAELVERLLGAVMKPVTRQASNLLGVCKVVSDLAESARTIVIKAPDAAGGSGNVVFDAARIHHRSLACVRQELQRLLQPLHWDWSRYLQISGWESSVVCSPSAQLWIPPAREGPPVLQGVFQQMLIQAEGQFVGSHPAQFPTALLQRIAHPCRLLGLVMQHLSYVGRCSFDMILIGPSLEEATVHFIECNARWGGTSGPMHLVQRLPGRLYERPYIIRQCEHPGLRSIRFDQLCDRLGDVLYSAKTGQGWLVLFTPALIKKQGRVGAVMLGDTWEQVRHRLEHEWPERLEKLLADRARSSATLRGY